MDDGSHADTIDQDGEMAERQLEKQMSRQMDCDESRDNRPSRFQNDLAHLIPSRWWFASSAFPMIAATLGPVASAFSICALGSKWRQHIAPGKSIDDATFVQDPVWLTVVNAIQLAMALVSNAFLLLNMTKRVRFSIAQPITIIGWYISAICLMALTATAAGPLTQGLTQPLDEYVWAQAFWYGIWAAILYFVDASLMLVTFWGASSGHYAKDFNLTPSQRTLMLQTILFLMYLLLGALVFSTIEGWKYLDAVYWADVTLFTVGFGDFAASTNLGRALLLPYALIGVISLGLVISSIRSMILERGRRRVDARMEEKNRRRTIKAMSRRGRDDILEPLRSDTLSQWDDEHADLPGSEFERRRTEFLLMRKIQQQASIRRKWLALAVSAGVWVLLWTIGAVIFMQCEKPYQNWEYFDAFYFCFVSFTTIGYGDRTPESNAGKSFFVFWSLLSLPTMTVLISNAGDTVVKFVRDATIRLGNITILPGEDGFTGNAKYVTNRLTMGHTFQGATAGIREHEEHQRRMKSLHGATGHPVNDEGKHAEQSNGSSNRQGSVKSSGSQKDLKRGRSRLLSPESKYPLGRRSLSRVRDRLNDLPTGTEFLLLLVKEIEAVSQHLREPGPRRYTFDEWAWYLGLIGEDESDPDNHRKATPKKKEKRGKHHHHSAHARRKGKETHEAADETPTVGEMQARLDAVEEDPLKWSWVGNRSPLMGGQEESEWIQDKLMERLQESLLESQMDEER